MLLTLALLAQVATATPAPPVALSGGFGRPAVKTTATATVARRGTFSVTGSSPVAVAAPAHSAEAAALPGAEPKSLEESWRSRVAGLRGELAAAEAEYEAQSSQITVVAGRPGRDYHLMMAMRDAALAPIRAKLMGIRRDLRALPEECRTTPGCQPGWIR